MFRNKLVKNYGVLISSSFFLIQFFYLLLVADNLTLAFICIVICCFCIQEVDFNSELVCIHDSARPLVLSKDVQKVWAGGLV